MAQQGDVILFQSLDDGEIIIRAGVVEMDGGLQTAGYLSLFGGNEDDDGREDNPLGYWGNAIGDDPNERQVSRTQYLLRSIPATSGNLLRIEDAATTDLQWLIEVGAASTVNVAASIPALNRVKLAITIEAIGEESSFEFVENWKASA
jgi:phage gp46-like protein